MRLIALLPLLLAACASRSAFRPAPPSPEPAVSAKVKSEPVPPKAPVEAPPAKGPAEAAPVKAPADAAPAKEPGGAVAPKGPTEADRAAVRKMVEEIREEAAKIRGLAWKRGVPADLMTRAQLREDFLKDLKEEMTPEEIERDTKTLRRLGLIKADEDPVMLQMKMLEEMVAGFYSPKKGHFFVIEGMAGEAQKPTILHELTHALEDQYIDLQSRVRPLEDDSDRAFAEKCIEEGSAEHAREIYEKAHPDVSALFMKAQMDPKMMATQVKVLGSVPAFLIVGTLLQYQLGPQFVSKAVGDDYVHGMDRLYADPPVSQEQLMHPRKWFGDHKDFPQIVVWGGDLAQAAGEGWKKLQEIPVGELDLALYFDFFLGGNGGKLSLTRMAQRIPVADRPLEAARGWDAGRTVFLEKAGLPIGVVNAWAFDTVEDAAEAFDAFVDCAKALYGDSFEAGESGPSEGGTFLDYTGKNGAGRIVRRDAEILHVDGFPADRLEAVWSWVARTRFAKDTRDTWDPDEDGDPLAGTDFSDKARGIAVNKPGEGWTVQKLDPPPPGAFARLDKGEVNVVVAVVDLPVPLAAVLPMLEGQLKKQFPDMDAASKTPTSVGPAEGVKYRMGKGPDGRFYEVYLGSASGRLYIVRASAPEEPVLRAADDDVKKILASIVSAKE